MISDFFKIFSKKEENAYFAKKARSSRGFERH